MRCVNGWSGLCIHHRPTDMIITGRFLFLHRLSVAWLLKARRACLVKQEPLTVKLMPVPLDSSTEHIPAGMRSFSSRAVFLDAFHFADAINPWEPDDPVPGDVPIPSDAGEVQALLDPWLAPLQETVIFSKRDQFQPVMEQIGNRTRITTNGCFDILHPGHLATLQYAASLGDILIVLINSDASVRRFKGPSRPIHTSRFRAALLSRLDAVDFVIVFQEDTPLDALDMIRPHGHVKGGSFLSERIRAEQDVLDRWGGKFYTHPMEGDYSTTRILTKYSGHSFPL